MNFVSRGKQKERKPADNVSKEEYVKKFKALCDAYEIKLPNREYDIYHLCDDLSKLSIDSDKQKPAEWSEEDEKMLSVISYKISQHQGNDERSLFTPDEAEFIGRLEDKLKSLLPQPHTVSIKDATKFGNLEYERGVKDGIQSEKSHHWKPSEEQISALEYFIRSWGESGVR